MRKWALRAMAEVATPHNQKIVEANTGLYQDTNDQGKALRELQTIKQIFDATRRSGGLGRYGSIQAGVQLIKK